VKEKQGKDFNHKKFKNEFWRTVNKEYGNMDFEYAYFTDTGYKELEEALIRYIVML
jgi:G:T/U-mismatch repair DNA glycosylase